MSQALRLVLALVVAWIAVPVAAAKLEPKLEANGKNYVLLTGDIIKGDADRLRRIATAYKLKAIFLSSRGGSLTEALEIGRIVATNNYTTVVVEGAECASSCALIWLAGSPRVADPEAHIGFHASYTLENGKPYESGAANALVGRYLTQLGLSDKAVLFATSAPPSGMAWLDTGRPGAEGIDYRVITPSAKTTVPAERVQPPVIESVPAYRSNSTARAAESPIGKMFGFWMVAVVQRAYTAFTTDESKAGVLAMACIPGKTCRSLIRLNLECDAGDAYEIEYQVDGYPKKTLATTCSTDKQTLYVNDSLPFLNEIYGEANVTFATENENGHSVTKQFPLHGFDQAVIAMKKAGLIGASQ